MTSNNNDTTATNYYMDQPTYIISVGSGTTPTVWDTSIVPGGVVLNGDQSIGVSGTIKFEKNERGLISPELYFTFVKKKFGFLERPRLERRLHRIEAAFDKAVENGQNMLAEKILSNFLIETRETAIYAKGVTKYIERTDLYKHKSDIKGGHIADTILKDYTRVIPKDVAKKIEKVKHVFDDFVIFHYYNKETEKQIEKKQKMSSEEKSKMRDPIVFGIIKETDKLYYVADWIDEHCDLTFRKIVDVIGGHKTIDKIPKLV